MSARRSRSRSYSRSPSPRYRDRRSRYPFYLFLFSNCPFNFFVDGHAFCVLYIKFNSYGWVAGLILLLQGVERTTLFHHAIPGRHVISLTKGGSKGQNLPSSFVINFSSHFGTCL